MNSVSIGFVCYLAMILIVRFYTASITNNPKDFALGGQRLGPTVIAFSERASGESTWLILGLSGAALVAGMLEIWTVIGCLGGIIVSWFIVAYPFRQETEKYNAITPPEYFEKKFDDESGILRLVSSLIITFFSPFMCRLNFLELGKSSM